MKEYLKKLITRLEKISDTEINGRNLIDSLKIVEDDIRRSKYSSIDPINYIYLKLDGICWDGQPLDFDDDGDEMTMCSELDSLINESKQMLDKN